jgi:hypothetical protein
MDNRTNGNLEKFVGLNAAHYLAQWEVMDSKKLRALWHWRAFLFAPVWLAGRKLYFHAFLYYVILYFALFFGGLLKLPPFVSFLVVSIPFQVFTGLAAYRLYRSYCESKIEQYLKFPKQGIDEKKFYARYGGVNLIVGFVALALFFYVVAAAHALGNRFEGWMHFGMN